MPSFLEIIKAGPQLNNPTGQRCRTCVWVDNLQEEERDALTEAIASGAWPVSHLYRIAKDFGLTVSESGFRQHVKEHQRNVE